MEDFGPVPAYRGEAMKNSAIFVKAQGIFAAQITGVGTFGDVVLK
jgi:hypothetical protein